MYNMLQNYIKQVYNLTKEDEIEEMLKKVRFPKLSDLTLGEQRDWKVKDNPFIDSYHLQDVQVASEIMQMKKDKKWILITDYDCDGLSCAAIGYRVLKNILGLNIDIYTNRRRYGNGVNMTILNEIGLDKFKDYDLLITADHGSVDDERYAMLKTINPTLDIIVTDHHEIPKPLEHADAFINNQRKFKINQFYNCKEGMYPEFSGCGIFACLLYYFTYTCYGEKKANEVYPTLLAFTALTLVSDVMSMKDIRNRYIVKKGIPYVYMLLKFHPLADDLRYKIIPMVNSGNRMHCEEIAYELLTAMEEEARMQANLALEKKNNERKEITSRCRKETAFFGKKIGVGVAKTQYAINGIIAGKMLESYPAVICFQDTGNTEHYSGSCRSRGINILQILRDAKELGLVQNVGGHKLACGCHIHKDKLDDLINYLDNLELKEEDLSMENIIIPVKNFNLSGLKYGLELLEPFGKDFEVPYFSSILKFKESKIGREPKESMPETDYYYTFEDEDKHQHRFYRRSYEDLTLERNKMYKLVFSIKAWMFVGSKPEYELHSCVQLDD